jgi:hypothetical protein
MSEEIRFAYQVIPTDKVSEPVLRALMNDKGEEGDKIARDGVFSSDVTLDPPGEYRVTVLARGPTFERSLQIPFRVKPRLVNLELVEYTAEELEHLSMSGAAEGHGTMEHHDHAEGEEEEEAAELDAKMFRITLSEEASALKKVELKFVAIDAKKRRYSLPIIKVKGEPTLFHVSLHRFPHSGEYEVQAMVSGNTSTKKVVSGASLIVKYNHDTGKPHEESDEPEEIAVNAPVKKKVVEKQPVWLMVVVMTLLNALAALIVIKLSKPGEQTSSVALPVFAGLEPLLAMAAELKASLNLGDTPPPAAEGAAEGTPEAPPEAEAPPPAAEEGSPEETPPAE